MESTEAPWQFVRQVCHSDLSCGRCATATSHPRALNAERQRPHRQRTTGRVSHPPTPKDSKPRPPARTDRCQLTQIFQ